MKVGRIHKDNATKFISMKAELKKIGITFTISPAHNPQSNGLIVRMKRTLLEKAQSMIGIAK